MPHVPPVGVVMTVCSSNAVILNLLLVPLIIFCSGPAIGFYKYLLLMYTLIAIMYAICTILSLPCFATGIKGWIFYANVEYFSRTITMGIIVWFCACYIQLMTILVYSFLYRFIVICRSHDLVWFHTRKRLTVLILIYIFFFMFYAFGLNWNFLSPSSNVTVIFQDEIMIFSGVNLSSVAYLGAVIYDKNDHLNHNYIPLFAAWTTFLLTAISVIIFCILRIVSAFKTLQSVSVQSLKLQKQLFVLLLLQTIFPILLSFLPVLLSYVLAFVEIKAISMSTVYSSLLPMAQIFDPIIMFFLIADYRNAVVKYLRIMRCLPAKVAEQLTTNAFTGLSALSVA